MLREKRLEEKGVFVLHLLLLQEDEQKEELYLSNDVKDKLQKFLRICITVPELQEIYGVLGSFGVGRQ